MSAVLKEEAKPAKEKPVVRKVTMTDGREVEFVGKRRLNKEYFIDSSAVDYDKDGGVLTISTGAVKVRMDFDNGETRTMDLPLSGDSGILVFAGHGGVQKFGDNLASSAADPLSADDMVEATDALYADILAGKWGKGRAEGGGAVSGASIVVKALMEATGKTVDEIKAYLQKKLDTTEGLTRKALYDSFRVRGTKVGEIIAKMEDEKRAKEAKVDADASVEEIMNS